MRALSLLHLRSTSVRTVLRLQLRSAPCPRTAASDGFRFPRVALCPEDDVLFSVSAERPLRSDLLLSRSLLSVLPLHLSLFLSSPLRLLSPLFLSLYCIVPNGQLLLGRCLERVSHAQPPNCTKQLPNFANHEFPSSHIQSRCADIVGGSEAALKRRHAGGETGLIISLVPRMRSFAGADGPAVPRRRERGRRRVRRD